MKINRDIWTGSFHDTTNPEIEYGDTLLTMIKNKKLFLNTDYNHSISPWAIPPQRIGAYRFFDGKPQCVGVLTANEISFYRYPATNSDFTGIHTYFNNAYYDTGTNFTAECLTCWAPEQKQKESVGYRHPYGARPIYNFDYNKFVGGALVKAANITSSGTSVTMETFWFKDYFDNPTNMANYPYILSMHFSFRYKTKLSSCSSLGMCMSNVRGTWDKSKLNEGYGDVLVENTIGTPIYASSGVIDAYSMQIIGMVNREGEEPANDHYLYYGHGVGQCNASNIRYIKRDDLVTKWVYSTSDPEAFTHNVYPLYKLTKKQAAEIVSSYGIVWSEVSHVGLDSNYTHIPKFVDGTSTTESTNGADNVNNPAYNWKNSWIDAGYTPGKTDPNKYTDKIKLSKPAITTTGIFNRTFALNSVNVNQLAGYLWNADDTIFKQIVDGLSLMGGNPIDGIIDLRLYPFDVATKSTNTSTESIVIGRTDTKINGIKISNYNAILDLGSCTFFPYFGNFLDYEPFTSASLYIPYVGIVPISTANFMGQTISCKMVVDITTGSCTAVVFANDIPIIYKNGTIGVEIPMTGTNSAEYASRIIGGLTSGATDFALGAASNNIGQIVSGAGQIAESALSVNNTMYNTAGSSSPACGLWQPQNCYFIINRPVPIVPDNYGHTVGYACNYNANLSSLSGFTCCYNVDLSSLYASDEEMNEINSLLANGIYL